MGIELLAPAGSAEALTAAVQNGADAVYLGLQSFGARQYAENFDVEALRDAAKYCHLRGVQIHVAMNTMLYERELPQAAKLAEQAVQAGADALIIQDVGLADTLRKAEIPIPLHASTQMTIHNAEGARFAKEMGFGRVVLSRELPAAEIAAITKEVPIETEVFIHGALCMSYSGQCLLSSMIGGRSGNRGRCAQPCRLPYEMLEDGKTIAKGYLMSPKDLCLGAYIPALTEMGVSSLKIEGRMKSAAYVAAATQVYRRCIDENRAMTAEEESMLENVFSRERFTQAFYAGKTGKGMMKTQSSNDDIYDKQDPALVKALQQTYAPGVETRYKDMDMTVEIQVNQPLRASAEADDHCVTAMGQTVQTAKANPVTEEMVKMQMEKLGGSNFRLRHFALLAEEGAFVPKSALNALRRDLTKRLEERLGQAENASWHLPKTNRKRNANKRTEPSISIWTENAAQAAAFANQPVERIYVPNDCIQEIEATSKIAVYFPTILREKAMERAEEQLLLCRRKGIDKIASGNVGLLLRAKEMGFSVYGTADLNIANAASAAFWKKFGMAGAEVSRELNLHALKDLTSGSPLEIEVTGYGNVALMKIENCLIRIAKDGCGCQKGKTYMLKDRKGALRRVTKQDCVSTVYNSVPVYMADRMRDLQGSGVDCVKLVFTEESPQQCLRIYSAFASGDGVPSEAYTRGHFYRGAQ